MKILGPEAASSESTPLPLVSCLCVTRGKPDKLARALRCFEAQTYPHRELVLLVEEDDAPTLAAVDVYRRNPHGENVQVHVVSVAPKLPLGELRNRAIAICRGDYFCQWDDDDWFHADRVAAQVAAVTGAFQSATMLTNWLMFDANGGHAYLSSVRLWEGSLLCRKSVLTESLRYPPMSRMEDSFFVNDLIGAVGVLPQIAPTLYIYEIHGSNTCTSRHFGNVLSAAQPLSAAASAIIREIMIGGVSVSEGSELLGSRAVLEGLRYVPRSARMTTEELEEYLREMAT
jgi:glycosyltransferase involved in cell wall biosynthesis